MKLLSAFAIVGATAMTLGSQLASAAPLDERGVVTWDDNNYNKILYSPNGWTHASKQDQTKLYGGTESYSHSPDASYSFYTTNYGKFAIWGGKKPDRGYFDVHYLTWDGVSYYLGRGDAYGTGCTGVCKAVELFSFDLAGQGYTTAGTIVVNSLPHDNRSGGTPWLELDKIVLS